MVIRSNIILSSGLAALLILAAPELAAQPDASSPDASDEVAAEDSSSDEEASADAGEKADDGSVEDETDDDEGEGDDDDSGEGKAEAGPKPAPSPRRPARLHRDLRPRLHHAPVAAATAHEPLRVIADIEHPQLVKRALLVYRTPEEPGFREVEFRRGMPGPYVAIVPAADVKAPVIDYTIELERSDSVRVPIFSSRAEPHRVQVPEDGMDMIERALAERLDDRRSVFSSRAEYVSFGTSTANVTSAEGVLEERQVDDRYYRVEGSYAYRPLGVVSEFSIRVGIVRGSAPVPVRDLLPGQEESERFDVGLNYGAPMVRFRLGESWHLDGSFLVNVTEVGFSVGTGSALHIGDPYGSKLTLGFEAIQTFGMRFYSQVDIQAHERVKVSPIVEVTNMPSADDFGVRLLGEVGVDVGWGFAAAARGGYQARHFTSGGPSGGGMLSYAF